VNQYSLDRAQREFLFKNKDKKIKKCPTCKGSQVIHQGVQRGKYDDEVEFGDTKHEGTPFTFEQEGFYTFTCACVECYGAGFVVDEEIK
jgi:plastocyanin